MNNQNIKVHIFISGRVQGVFFRQFIQEKAQELGLVGWIKNLDDGRVEAVIEGDKEKIDKILTYLKQGSPCPSAISLPARQRVRSQAKSGGSRRR